MIVLLNLVRTHFVSMLIVVSLIRLSRHRSSIYRLNTIICSGFKATSIRGITLSTKYLLMPNTYTSQRKKKLRAKSYEKTDIRAHRNRNRHRNQWFSLKKPKNVRFHRPQKDPKRTHNDSPKILNVQKRQPLISLIFPMFKLTLTIVSFL